MGIINATTYTSTHGCTNSWTNCYNYRGYSENKIQEDFKSLQNVFHKLCKIKQLCQKYNIGWVDAVSVLLTNTELQLAKKFEGQDLDNKGLINKYIQYE